MAHLLRPLGSTRGCCTTRLKLAVTVAAGGGEQSRPCAPHEDGDQSRLSAPTRVAETAGATSSRSPAWIYRGHRLLVAPAKEAAVALTCVCHSTRRCPPSPRAGHLPVNVPRVLAGRCSNSARTAFASSYPAPDLHRGGRGQRTQRARKRRELELGRRCLGLGSGEGGSPLPDLRWDREAPPLAEEGDRGGLTPHGRMSSRPCSAR